MPQLLHAAPTLPGNGEACLVSVLQDPAGFAADQRSGWWWWRMAGPGSG